MSNKYEKVMGVIEHLYGDCACDQFTQCKFCKAKIEIQEILSKPENKKIESSEELS